MQLATIADRMWWKKRQHPETQDFTINAHLQNGELLQIRFDDGREPRELDIDGRGDVRLKFKGRRNVTAELRH